MLFPPGGYAARGTVFVLEGPYGGLSQGIVLGVDDDGGLEGGGLSFDGGGVTSLVGGGISFLWSILGPRMQFCLGERRRRRRRSSSRTIYLVSNTGY